MIKLVIPALLGYTTAMRCPISSQAGRNVWFRPPAWVFGLVWPVLYALLGYAWSKTDGLDYWYAALSLILALWIYVYGCRRDARLAFTILIASICIAVMTSNRSPPDAKTLIMPLIYWLIFASTISFKENLNNGAF